jgi:cobyrinic acid a,c-diamide synthase
MQQAPFPRLVIAGLSGGSGKTLVSMALALAARRRGLAVRAFKKGPDYIDTAWLEWASGHTARNLDSWLMGFDVVAASFARTGCAEGLNLIEGNRGLYDGLDARGTHSTAELAKALGAPVILVVDATKATRTVAACVLGCRTLDPQVNVAGVILNQVSGARHERVIREAIERDCGIAVLGALPRLGTNPLPERHLGLAPPAESETRDELGRRLEELAAALEVDRLMEIAAQCAPCCLPARKPGGQAKSPLHIGYLRDSAFTFYYAENLEALEAGGAKLAAINSLRARELPRDIDSLYIGGGFPEMCAEALSHNDSLLASIRHSAVAGLPIYAECGGLMLLSRTLRAGGTTYPMAGVLPFETEMCSRPQGHGYVELRVERQNAFYPVGLRLKGHEFHYSRIVGAVQSACSAMRGSGPDGVVSGNVWASYTHVHALGAPEWAEGILAAASRHASALAGAV